MQRKPVPIRLLYFLTPILCVVFAGTLPVLPDPPDEGERLAKTYCGGCHLYPEPALLPKELWQNVILPRMGHQLGIYEHDTVRAALFEQGLGGQQVRERGVFPERPLLAPKAWRKIKDFYLTHAPDSLPLPPAQPVTVGLKHFRTRVPAWHLSPPSATMVRFRPGGGLLLGDANTKRLYWIGDDLNVEKAANLAEGIVDVQRDPGGMYLTIMGSFSPTDAPVGAVVYMSDNSPRAQLLLEGLQRPVHSTWADLDGDGRTDGVVCEYAKWTGGLSYWRQQPDGSFLKTVLRYRPGAIRSYIRDLNGDGHPDILALFGQGDEGIFRYLNDGKGNFREEPVLRFPATWGSSSFRLTDVNGDGLEDIVYTCGDNADYKPILKPYHGIRIYTNNGHGGYDETYFYPLHGAYDAIVADFDGDGDLDIGAVAFFPDFQSAPNSGFVLLENQGDFRFEASTFPEVQQGRWMLLDASDWDADGDLDILLGPLTFEVVPDNGEVRRWVQAGLPFVVLENTRY